MDNNELVDESVLQKDVQNIREILEKAYKKEEKTFADTVKGGLKKIGIEFSTKAFVEFSKEIVKVRGEFQQLEVTLTTLTGSKSKANKLLNEIAEMAVNTPFDFSALASGAEQLLLTGMAAEDITNTLSTLGEIAAGLSLPLSNISALYLEMQGKNQLMGEDLEKFTSIGIPLMDELASMFGMTNEELSTMVNNGLIGFPDVQKALESLTGSGGQFNGMMDEQSNTLKGQVGNFQDAWDNMLNVMGEKSEGILSMGMSMATSLVKNYELVGSAIYSLVAAYGTVKAAYLVTSAIKVKDIALDSAKLASTNKLIASTKVLNLTMMKNPLIAIIAIAVGAIAFITTYTKKTDEAADAQERYNKKKEEGAKRDHDYKQEVQGLISTIQDETETEEAKIRAYEELAKMSPALANSYDLEALKTLELAEAQRLLNEARDQQNYDKLISDIDAATIKIAELEAKQGKVIGYVGYAPFRADHSEEIEQLKQDKALYEEELAKIQEAKRQAEENAKPIEVRLLDLKNDRNQLAEALKEAKKDFEDEKEKYKSQGFFDFVMPVAIKAKIESIENEIAEKDGKIEGLERLQSATKNYKELIRDAIAEINKEQAKLDELKAPGAKTTADDLAKAQQALSKAKGAYRSLTGEDYKPKDLSSLQEALNKQLLDAERAFQKERINLMSEGRAKRLELSRLEYEGKKEAVEKEFQEIEKKYKELGQATPDAVKKDFEQRLNVNEKDRKKRDNNIDDGYNKEIEEREKKLTSFFLSEEQKRVTGIEERYQKERDWAKEQEENGLITEEQYFTYVFNVNRAEIQEKLKGLLADVDNFEKQRARLTTEWNDKIKTATDAGDKELAEQLTKNRDKALSELNSKMIMESTEWVRLFGNLDRLTVKELDSLIASIQNKINSGEITLNAADTKKLLASLGEAKDKVAQKSPFKGLVGSLGDLKKAYKELRLAKKEGLTGEALDVYKNKVSATAANVAKALTAVKKTYGEVNDVMTAGKELVSIYDDEIAETMDNAMALGNAVMGIGDVVSEAVTGFANGMSAMETASVVLLAIKAVLTIVSAAIKLFNNDKKHDKKIKGYQDEIDNLQKAYDNLGRAIDKAYSTDAAGKIDEQNENLEKQQELIRKQMEEEENKKKTDKDKLKEYQNKLEEIDRKIADNKEKAKDAIFGSDLKTAIDEFAQAYADAWAAGEDRAESMKGVVKNMMKGIVMEMLKSDLSGTVAKIRNTIADIIKNGGTVSDSQMAEFERMIDADAARLDKEYAWANKYMVDKKEEGDTYQQESSQSAFASMSQETGDELNGRFTALQIAGEALRAQSVEQSAHLLGISEKMDAMRVNNQLISMDVSEIKDIALTSMYHLAGIEKNTKHLQFMREDLSRIKEKVNNL